MLHSLPRRQHRGRSMNSTCGLGLTVKCRKRLTTSRSTRMPDCAGPAGRGLADSRKGRQIQDLVSGWGISLSGPGQVEGCLLPGIHHNVFLPGILGWKTPACVDLSRPLLQNTLASYWVEVVTCLSMHDGS